MNVVINILKDEGYNIPSELEDYYSNIELWQRWWEGYVKEVHDYSDAVIDGTFCKFKRKQTRMAKRVSEDWANLLLTNKTLINVEDEVSQKFLAGDELEQNGGVLGTNRFWLNGNKLIENAYAQGTAAIVLRVNEATLEGNMLTGGKISLEYIDDATMIYPLSWSKGEVTECAFGSICYVQGKRHLYLEKHLLGEKGNYKIVNEFFNYEKEKPVKTELPNGVVEEFEIGCKLFHIIVPNVENNIYKKSPLGISVYANSLDQLEACDIAYDNFVSDFFLGRKRVFINQDVIQLDEKGKPNMPRTMESRLFYSMGKTLSSDNKMFEEYNPQLRVEENRNGIQTALDILSQNVGFGQHRYSFEKGGITTATEVKSSNKDLTESVAKQRTMIEDFLNSLVKSILWLGKNVIGENVNPDAKVTITFDDSMFQDPEAERQQMIQEIREGIRQKWEYRVKYLGEDEATAKAMVQEEEQIEFPGVE